MSTTVVPKLAFGSYDWICSQAALVVCPLVGTSTHGIEPVCYARNVQIGTTLIFQPGPSRRARTAKLTCPATAFLHVCALFMVLVMVLHVRSKYTAVGRKEIVTFFYLYAVVELLSLFLDTAIIPASSNVYPVRPPSPTRRIRLTFPVVRGDSHRRHLRRLLGAARERLCRLPVCRGRHPAVALGAYRIALTESDPTQSLRLSSLAVFLVTGFVAIATFKSIAGLSPAAPTGLWILEFIFNAACVLIYVVLQLILVIRTLDDRWPIGDIAFGVVFFAAGQVILYGFSVTICDAVKHYIDGIFFATLCILLSVMMVYKYWDSITKEDLEFSVGSKQAVWEVKESLLKGEEDETMTMGQSYGASYGSQGQPGYPPVPTKYGERPYGY